MRQDRYGRLVARFPLRPIRSEAELDEAGELAGRLALRDDLADDERDYLEVLGELIARYEETHHPIRTGRSGVATLKYLIEENGLSLRSVGEATGIQVSTLSEILSGKRVFTVRHLVGLGRFFRVDPGLFLDSEAD